MNYKIMIVEDDYNIRTLLKDSLEKWNYEVVLVTDFNALLSIFQKTSPHLILMDIGLPSFNGYYWTQEIRKVSKVPILFMSSRSDDMDIIMAVQTGGDDYITKPFSMELLLAKVQALLRRSYDLALVESSLQVSGLTLKLDELTLYYGGEELELTKTETQMLKQLMNRPGKFITREELCIKLWESDEFIDDNTLSVNMSRLRRKLSVWGIDTWIQTKKGYGYKMEEVKDEA